MEIRKIIESEYEYIRDLMYKTIPESTSWKYSMKDIREKEDVCGDFYPAMKRGDMVFIAEEDGEFAGYIHFGTYMEPDFVTGELYGYIYDIYVMPQFRRMKVATTMMRGALDWFKKKGFREAATSTFPLSVGWKLYNNFEFRIQQIYLEKRVEPVLGKEEKGFTIRKGQPEEIMFMRGEMINEISELTGGQIEGHRLKKSGLIHKITLPLSLGADLLVIETEGRVAAFVIFSTFDDTLTPGRMAEIDFIYVAGEYRRRGYGKALLGSVETFLEKNMVETVFVKLFENNPSNEFFNAYGFDTFSYYLRKKL